MFFKVKKWYIILKFSTSLFLKEKDMDKIHDLMQFKIIDKKYNKI
jgi:hypothetical protein